jgi:hypothetical protein
MRRGRSLCGLSILALAVLAAPAAAEEHEKDRPLEQAREESGVERAPPSRHALPGAELKVTPNQLLAGRPGQKIRFSVALRRRVPDATLTVTLPRRWLERPASGLAATRVPRLRSSAGGRARLRRRDRAVTLGFADAAADSSASFEVTDLGIPAGTYRLRFAWRDARGRTLRAGTAKVVIYARVREGPEEQAGPFGRLASPGVTTNATADSNEESETFIAVTPGNKNRIAVGANWQSASMSAWISGDGGQTWTLRTLPQAIDAPGEASNESGLICCDPMFAADSLGNIWYGGLADYKNSTTPSRIVVNRIASGGTTFRPATVGLKTRTPGTGELQDKPMMTIDDTPTSPTFGRLYVVWDEPAGGGINVVTSQCDTRPSGLSQPANCDNADNWTAPVSVSPATGSYIYADVAVGPDGRVYVTWWDYSNANAIRGDVCNPGSQNCASAAGWGTPQTIALLDKTGNQPLPFACPILAQPGGRASTSPQVDVDHSGGANNGRVYVTWSDLRTGSGSTRCADGDTPLATHLTFDSFVASAAGGALPGGASASPDVATRLITDGEGGGQANSDDWFAWLAIDQTNGQAWADLYSTRLDSSRDTTNFYARSVTPSGGSHTLGTLTKVSTAASDYSAQPCCGFGNDYGDYTGIAATQGIAYPVWTDNSTGEGEAFTFVSQVQSPQAPGVTTGGASGVGQTSATVNGTVDPNGQSTTYHFEYGTTTGYGTPTPDANAGSGPNAGPVSADLSGLAPGTPYHYRLVATNSSGTTLGNDATFNTLSPPPPGTPPTAVTDDATGVQQDSATLNGTINPNGSPTSFHFEYGTTSGVYTALTPGGSAGSGSAETPVSKTVSGLSIGTTYYFRVVADNGSDPAVAGGELTFKTASPTPPPAEKPAVATGAASLIAQASATVSGTVNPKGLPTTYRFQYGTTTNYGSSTTQTSAGAGATALGRSASLQFLSANTTYHYRITATNTTGTTNGADRTFRTASVFEPAPLDTAGPLMGVSTRALRLARSGAIRVRVRCATGEPQACSGVLRLYTWRRFPTSSGRRRIALGSARFSIAPGTTRGIRERINRRGRRLLRREGRFRVLASARARDAAGNLGAKRVRFVLRAPGA